LAMYPREGSAAWKEREPSRKWRAEIAGAGGSLPLAGKLSRPPGSSVKTGKGLLAGDVLWLPIGYVLHLRWRLSPTLEEVRRKQENRDELVLVPPLPPGAITFCLPVVGNVGARVLVRELEVGIGFPQQTKLLRPVGRNGKSL